VPHHNFKTYVCDFTSSFKGPLSFCGEVESFVMTPLLLERRNVRKGEEEGR